MNLPEFRLYYSETGSVLFYTCDKPEGNFIVIDSQTYFESRFDIKIVDKKIVPLYDKKLIAKLMPSVTGISCYNSDISIVYDGSNSKKWNLKIYER